MGPGPPASALAFGPPFAPDARFFFALPPFLAFTYIDPAAAGQLTVEESWEAKRKAKQQRMEAGSKTAMTASAGMVFLFSRSTIGMVGLHFLAERLLGPLLS